MRQTHRSTAVSQQQQAREVTQHVSTPRRQLIKSSDAAGSVRHEYAYAHPSPLRGTPRAESVRQWFPLAMHAKHVQNNTTGHEPPRCLHSRLMAWRRTEGRLKHAHAASIVPPHARGFPARTKSFTCLVVIGRSTLDSPAHLTLVFSATSSDVSPAAPKPVRLSECPVITW